MATFSDRISELKLEKEISSQDLAAIVGVARFTIDRWRQGKVHLHLSHAIILADYFECTLDYLVGRCDNERKFVSVPCPAFYSHFLAILDDRGISTYRLRLESQIKGGHLDKWKNGSDPLIPTLITAAEYLDVTLDYLVGRER